MRHEKSALAAFVVLAGLAAPAQAQQFGVGGVAGNTLVGNGVGFGYNSGYAGLGYGSGLGYGYPNYSGYNNRGYLPYYQTVPQTYNNMGGLMSSIRTQTGRGNSYRPNNAVGGFRRR